MIRYLEEDEKKRTEALYLEAFPEDKDVFVDYYYAYATKNNRLLVVEEEGEICAMLHLNPYRLMVNKNVENAYYYVAVATKESCRHQGMMRSLLYRSLNDIHGEGHPFTYLMPANQEIYEPFDFRIVYQQVDLELPPDPEKANEIMAKLFDVYTIWDDWYVDKKTEEERVCAGDPPFDIVPYIMTRITHVERMLGLLRSEKTVRVFLDVRDEIIPENNGIFLWEISEDSSVCRKVPEADERSVLKVTIAELTEFVFGKRRIEGLENIQVLSRICINEAV